MDFEQLGAFYLGREQAEDGELGDPLLYDSKDLTTHAFCVGMTGSGKTGLALGLLEEAAIDGVPVIAIDPKGDLGNLLLSFPNLAPEDFEPWVDAGAATREGKTPAEFAQSTAELWKNGLAKWGQTGARIAKMRATSDLAIFTPGSSAGRPLSIISSFKAPSAQVQSSIEQMQERVVSAVSGLLALVGADADPMQSPAHVFLSTVLTHFWNQGKDVEVADLVRAAMSPPIDRIGVLDLDTVFPANKRQALAMQLNSVLASPTFATWTVGEPLEIDSLLTAPDGRPRVSILSIAHLGERERQFFVTLLLNELLSWVRSQPGTSSLRAILYIDEVYGYFPPVANPPSKKPMLTLLKQARAFGLGVMLATQNPADLDYKGLSNCGTWFLGRLQTERDKLRVLEGLETASQSSGANFDTAKIDSMLSSMPKRTFLMNNVHDSGPTLFRTRWALSFLRGPLTRSEIARLSQSDPSRVSATAQPLETRAASEVSPQLAASSPARSAPAKFSESLRPALPEHVPERFLASLESDVLYVVGLIAESRLHYALARADVDTWFEPLIVARVDDPNKPWGTTWMKRPAQLDFDAEPATGASFAAPPRELQSKRSFKALVSKLKAQLYKTERIPYFECKKPKLISSLGESKEAFVGRVRQAVREKRDLEVEKLRAKHGKTLQALQKKIRKAELKVEREASQVAAKKTDTWVTTGSTMLGWALGGRGRRGIGTTARSAASLSKEKRDVELANQDLEQLRADYAALEQELAGTLEELAAEIPEIDIREKSLAPKKRELGVDNVALLWMPYRHVAGRPTEPAFRWLRGS